MSEIKSNIKCVKCQQNAETKPNRNEFTSTYPIRDKDGQIYCWDCYKNKSHCEGCQKSVANIKFPRSGQPEYPHCNGGYSVNCEEISNKVKFICSKDCSKKLADQKYQAWKEKLNQGWTKCEECVKIWIDRKSNEECWEWLKEERQHSRFIKLAQPGQGKLCPDHKNWEEGGKQEYKKWHEEVKNQAQKHWNTLSREERLKLVKRERPWGENYEEIVARPEIDAAVLRRFVEKASHEKHNCPDCRSKNYPNQEPMGGNNINNLSGSASENNSDNDNDNTERKQDNQQSHKNLQIQKEKNTSGDD